MRCRRDVDHGRLESVARQLKTGPVTRLFDLPAPEQSLRVLAGVGNVEPASVIALGDPGQRGNAGISRIYRCHSFCRRAIAGATLTHALLHGRR